MEKPKKVNTLTRNLIANYQQKENGSIEKKVLPGVIPTLVKKMMIKSPKIREAYRRSILKQIKELNHEINHNEEKPPEQKLTLQEIAKVKEIRRNYGLLAGKISEKPRREIRRLRRTIASKEEAYKEPEYFTRTAEKGENPKRNQEEMEAILEQDKNRLDKIRRRLHSFKR